MNTKKKKRKVRERGYDCYCLEILGWSLPYSFSLNKDKRLDEGAYSEHLTLEMLGKILNPGKFFESDVRITLLGRREVEDAVRNPKKRLGYEPRCLGVITLRGQQRDFWGSMPLDAAVLASNLLALGHYRYLVLSGQDLYWGKADITSLHFKKEFNSEDWL